jgi:hypothetical protein
MGVLTFIADARSTSYAFAVFCLIILGWLLFDNYILWGILLIVLGILGLFTIKFFFKIWRRPAKFVEKNYSKREHRGVFIGSILGGLTGLIYMFLTNKDTTPYTGNEFYFIIPLLIGAFIGHLIDKSSKKNI